MAEMHPGMPKLSINIDVDDIERGVAFYTAVLHLGLQGVHRDQSLLLLTGSSKVDSSRADFRRHVA